MKNFKIRMLSLGVLSSIIISSTPVFAKTNSPSENKVVTTVSASADKKIASTKIKLAASNSGGPVDDIVNSGGVLEYGDEGDEVSILQSTLCSLGFLNIATDVDGTFGSKTRSAVKSFQRSWNVSPVDGKVGKKTWLKIKYALAQD